MGWGGPNLAQRAARARADFRGVCRGADLLRLFRDRRPLKGAASLRPYSRMACDVQREELGVVVDRGELRKLADDVFRRVKKKTVIRLAEHRGVVERVAGGDDVVVERLEGGDGMSFLVGHAELIAGDAIVRDDEAVAEERGPAHLLDERLGELLERVREDDDLGPAAQLVEKVEGARQERQTGDHGLDLRKRDAVSIHDPDTVKHELVVVGFVARGATQLGNTGALGDGDPDFRREDALHVQGDDTLLHSCRRVKRRTLGECKRGGESRK